MKQPNPDDRPLHFADPADFGRLRELLRHVQYHEQGVMESLGIECRAVSGQEIPLLLRRTVRATPIDTLIRLFLMGVPVDVEAMRLALAPMKLETWLSAGLVRRQGDRIEGAVRLLPFQGLWLAFDLPPRVGAPAALDYVMGVGSSSLTLANLTVRRPARRALDLGTGCGLQAFLAARHSDQVVAADRNVRAVHLASFNARLNDLTNIDCRAGDLFEPVQGERFDLVVSNPPFVISPETHYIYRDSGMHGDRLVERILREVPPLLNDGGYCQILCNWAHVAGQDWRQRLASWLEESGCDAWVLRTDTFEPDIYAAKWIRHTERDDAEQSGRRFEQWVDYYQEAGIEAISAGLITVRRRDGHGHWFRVDDGPEKMLGPAGESIAAGFEAHDFLQRMRDEETFLAQRFRVAPDVHLEQSFSATPEGWNLVDARLEIRRGLAYSGSIDAYLLRWLSRCDGRQCLGNLLRGLAEEVQEDMEKIVPACVEVARRLVERGFLLPVIDPEEASSGGS